MRRRFLSVILCCACCMLALPTPSAAQEQPPRILNAAELGNALRAGYPQRLRLAGVGAIAEVTVFVTPSGSADSIRLTRSTGLNTLDAAADRLARRLRFAPPSAGMPDSARWVTVPFTFAAPGRDPLEPVAVADRDAALRTASQAAPADLRDRGILASAGLVLDVAPDGTVAGSELLETTCFPDYDAAAERIARALRFEASTAGVRRTLATVHFGRDSVSLRLAGPMPPRRPPPGRPAARNPAAEDTDAATPPPRRPELQNAAAVQRAMLSRYPPGLRASGTGGNVVAWYLVGTDGRVVLRQISQGSGECALDRLALDLGSVMRFEPAMHDGAPVEVWAEIPLNFRASRQ